MIQNLPSRILPSNLFDSDEELDEEDEQEPNYKFIPINSKSLQGTNISPIQPGSSSPFMLSTLSIFSSVSPHIKGGGLSSAGSLRKHNLSFKSWQELLKF